MSDSSTEHEADAQSPPEDDSTEESSDSGDAVAVATDEPEQPEASAGSEPPEAREEPKESLSVRAARELSALQAVLRKTRRQERAPALGEGLAWFVATVGAVFVSAQFGGLLFGAIGVEVMSAMLGIGLIGASLGGLVALAAFVRGRPSLEEVARSLQRHVADFRSDIVAALQFGERLADGDETPGWSPSLAFEHLRRTTRALLARVDGDGSLNAQLPQRSLKPALLAIAGCLALLLLPYPLASERVTQLWEGVVFGVADKAGEPENRPIVGDIDLLYSFPPYANMQPRFEPFTTGHIETLVGSEVTLKTYPLIDASKFEIVVRTADGDRVVGLQQNRNRLQGTILLTKAGTYTFRATLPDGSVVEDGIQRSITLQPDQAPGVVLKSHTGEIEVSPDEVLEIEFAVEDDFGIETVSWATRFGEEEPKVRMMDLPELTTTPGTVEGTHELDLRELNLQPKDVVTFWMQSTDNNSLTGPGVGKSEPLVLRVASPEDRHMKVIGDQMEVLEKLLIVLAEFLENPAGTRSPNAKGFYRQTIPSGLSADELKERYVPLVETQQRQAEVLAQMSSVADRMAEDPLMAPRDVTLFRSLYNQLYKLDRDGAERLNRLASYARAGTLRPAEMQPIADWAAESEDALEKGLVRLDNLLASQKMESVKRTAQEIRDLKERLKELLERYRDERDPELKKAILREVQRLRQRMSELMARMQSQLKKLPQEHMNMEAIEQAQLESEANKMGENLQRIEDMLEQGDVDGALQALEDMTASLDELTKDMDEQFADAEPEGLREMDKALSELMDQANDLETRQRDLERRTREQQETQDEQERERIERMLEQKTSELARLAEQQRKQLEAMRQRDLARHDREAVEQAENRARQLEEMLGAKDMEQALQKARNLREDLRAIDFSLDLSQRYTDKKTDRGRDVRSSRDDLSQMQPRSQRIVKQLEEIMDQARSQQQSGDPQMKQLAGEQRETQRQAQQMQQNVKEAAERFPMIGEQLGQPLESAEQQMGEAQSGLQGSKPQRALDHQRAALEELRKLKQSMRDALQKRNQQGRKEGGRRNNNQKVVIPEKSGRSQEQFREDIMRGMKQERLEDYESEIERYYESLMQ